MDCRSSKVYDFVSVSRIMTENAKKSKALQLRWFRNYQWLCNHYREMEKQLDKLCGQQPHEIDHTDEVVDSRNCLPFPQTTNQDYGWLPGKPPFRLEKYGKFIIKYPNPMDKVYILSGGIPRLGGQKKYF